MFKEISKEEFISSFPDVDTYAASYDEMPVFLDNGVLLLSSEWNGEEYIESVSKKRYRPIYSNNNEDGNIIGYEECV